MKIKKIILNNYCQYYGKQSIEIPDNSKNSLIIIGMNGSGKSNLQKGISWCLYNEKPHKNNIDTIVNNLAKNQEKEIDMFIKINFKDKGTNYSITRGAKKSLEDGNDYSTYYRLDWIIDGEVFKEYDEVMIEEKINNILNESVKDYFFFNRRQIDSLAKGGHSKDVEKAIKKVLKIDAIKRSKDHIYKIVDKYRSNMSNRSDNKIHEKIKQTIKNLYNKKNNLEEKIENLENEINSADEEINKTSKMLDEIQENSKYKDKKSEILRKAQKIKDKIDNKSDKLEDILKKSHLFFCSKFIEDVTTHINKMDNKKIKDPLTIKEVLKDSLEKNKCFVCERELSKKQIEQINNKIPRINLEKTDQLKISKLPEKLAVLKNKAIYNYKDLNKLTNEINKLEDKLNEYNLKLEKYDQKISEELPDYSKQIHYLKKIKDKKTGLVEKMGSRKNELNNLDDKIIEAEQKEDDIIKDLEMMEEEKEKFKVAKEIRSEINNIYENFEEKEKEKINKKLFELFDKLIRKDDVFKKVFIDDNYKVRVFDKFGVETTISSGERQILSLSLVLSLARTTDIECPFIIDDALGDLDSEHKKNVLRMSKQVDQLFLLCSDTEFTDEYYKYISDDISAEYILEDNDGPSTEIRREMR